MVQFPTSMKSMFAGTHKGADKDTYKPTGRMIDSFVFNPETIQEILDGARDLSFNDITSGLSLARQNNSSIIEALNNVAQTVADLIVQEAQDNGNFGEDLGMSIRYGGEGYSVSVGDSVELTVSGSIGLDISGLGGEILDDKVPDEPQFAIVTHHAHSGRAGIITIEALEEILRRDREERNTIEGEVIKREDNE